MLHLQRNWASVLPVSSKGPSHSVASYNSQGDMEDLFYPGSLPVDESELETRDFVILGFNIIIWKVS
jgi:hypothetical protein